MSEEQKQTETVEAKVKRIEAELKIAHEIVERVSSEFPDIKEPEESVYRIYQMALMIVR